MTELEEDILFDDELLEELSEEQPEEHEHWRIEVDKGQSSVRIDLSAIHFESNHPIRVTWHELHRTYLEAECS